MVARAALLLTAIACGQSDRDGTPRASAPASGVVRWWLTTGDRSQLLSPQPDLATNADDVVSPATIQSGEQSVAIEVDTRQRFQVMHGFGAALTDASAWLFDERMAREPRTALLRELFSREAGGIGLSFVRITLGASDFSASHYTYDDVAPGRRDDPLGHFNLTPSTRDVIPVLRQALALNPELLVMASPWSAPGWMKTTGSLVSGTLREDAFDAYARYLVRAIEEFRAKGVPIALLSVQNEPDHEPPDYPGMRLDPAQRARLVGRHLGPLLASRGLPTGLLEWDHNWDVPNSPLAVLADTVARRYLRGVAWHCYAGDVSAQAHVHDRHPDIDTWFTECSGGAWAPDFGDNLRWNVSTLVIGATRHWARGIALWNLALDEQHGPHLGGCRDCRGVVTIDRTTGAVTRNEEYYALAHASRFVRPGAIRVASTTGSDSVENVAFVHDDDDTIVMVAVNLARSPRRLHVKSGEVALVAPLPAGAVATLNWRR